MPGRISCADPSLKSRTKCKQLRARRVIRFPRLILRRPFFTRSGASVKSTGSERLERYTALLTEYFAVPRHPYANEANWQRARAGIVSEFERIIHNVPNVTMEIQPFETEVMFTAAFPNRVEGKNIIVTFDGSNRGTDRDQILVVGAHYESDGAPLLSIDDNGSGVVAMLEVARGLADAILNRKAVLLNTVIFVAFDIQQFEHVKQQKHY